MTRATGLAMLSIVRRLRLGLTASLLALFPFGGCSGGTETGNPSFQVELSYTAYSSQPLVIGVREAGTAAVVDSAWLDLDTVALVDAGSCATPRPEQQSVPALGVGDHASGKHNLTRFELAMGSYCGLDLPFIRVPSGAIIAGQPPSLEQHSIMLAGALADGTAFSVLSSATPVVHLAADADSFEINAKNAQALIAFDVAAWLSNLDWASATRRDDGTIAISETQNAALLARFEEDLGRGVALYRDADGDGKLDVNPERLAHGE